MRGLGGHFHVTTGTNLVFQRDNHRVTFAFEKTFETAEQIFVDFAGDPRALFRQLFQTRLQSL